MAGFGNNNPNTKKQKIPKNGPQLLDAAVRAHKTGDITNAEALYLNAISSGFHHEIAFSNLGVIYKNTGRKEKALAIYELAVAKNPNFADTYTNLGNLYKDLGDLDQALASTLKSLELKPDNPTAHFNLGGIYKNLGDLDQALASTLKSLELEPDNPTAHKNLGSIYKNLGNLDQALASTLKALELEPDNPDALTNLGGIYRDLGDIDQALASILKSLELKPKDSKALLILGDIKTVLGDTIEAKKYLLTAIEGDPQEYGAYFKLSTMLETAEDAADLLKSINTEEAGKVAPQHRYLIEFAISNCLHKAKNYDEAAKHLQLANKNKLKENPSNIVFLKQAIAQSLSCIDTKKATRINTSSGKERFFLVGMPRSGSTLLETILSMNPEIKDLGETRSLEKAITKFQAEKQHNPNNQDLNEIYSQMEPLSGSQYKYSTDKQLYNFIYINWITTHMPAAKIIHCRRNPMDNILSMHRSNLMAGNNYTANLEDSAKVLVAHEQAMQINKKRYPKKIFTFDYDQFVNAPEDNLRKLLRWLDLDFDNNYLHPEKSTRSVNTASVMQARKPISNKSVGGWKNYETLLKPAFKIIQESGVKID